MLVSVWRETEPPGFLGLAGHRLRWWLLTELVASTPSFLFVLGGASRFDALRGNPHATVSLDGSGPAAIGAS